VNKLLGASVNFGLPTPSSRAKKHEFPARHYLLPVGDHHQLLDVQYYVSGVYYACVTLYEVWPIREGARLGSLVWRGDFFAAPTLAFTKGTDRLAYGAIMLQELKKAVRCFQKNVTANP